MSGADNIEATHSHGETVTGNDTAVEKPASLTKGEVADEGYDLFDETSPQAVPEEAANAVRRKIDLHLLPLMCALYGLNYVDKVAMGWAVLFDFREDLGLVGTEYSWSSSMFYFGYLIAQYPANFILQRYQTARILSFSILAWGVLMLAYEVTEPAIPHLGLRNFAGLMVVRFLLGAAESVVTPGFVLYTSMFYARKEQVMRTMLWAAMQGAFSIIASLMSFGLGHITNTALRPWKYIFLVLGLLSILIGFGWLFLMPQTPNKARFLTHEEQVIAVQRVAQNMMGIKGYQWKNYQLWHTLKDPKTWLVLAFVLFTQLPNGGLTSFGSLVISGFGFDSFRTLLIGLPSSVVSAGSMLIWGTFSIKYGNLRTWGMIVPLLPAIAGIAAVYATMNTGANKYGRVFAYWLINSYAVTWPFVLTIVGQNVAGHTKRAFTHTLLLIVFAAGNIAGPFFFRAGDAPGYVLAIASILVFFCVALFCAVALRLCMQFENRRRDRAFGALASMPEELRVDGMRLGMHDKTDLENPDFRYVL
ncbi:major facilitator superfamily domain-containing protein [Whalleya microplaca]|nr:major facilitator superfamily domain-containing protein [Whalleya microplaca]